MMDGNPQQQQRMGQIPRMIPEQIIAGEILQMPRLELEQRLRSEFEANPALSLEEVALCPMCDSPVSRYPCPSCGFRPPADDVPVTMAEDWETYRQTVHDDDDWEPFATVAGRLGLKEDLRGQWLAACTEDIKAVGLYLIEALDGEGYLREPLIEIAERFLWSVPQVESVLLQVQGLDPAGIGARDLRECLLLQCARREGGTAALAGRMIEECWTEMAGGETAAIARILGVDSDDAEEALRWVRKNLAPYPARGLREAWDRLAPREDPHVAPDVIIRVADGGFVVEIVESARFRVGVDTGYQRAWDTMSGRGGGLQPSFEHVRRSVSNARWLIDALAQRRRTLHNVMTAVAEAQREFLLNGRAHLKPLMQKTIAAKTGVHESTICRALADKLIRIPSGETIPSSAFFDASAPVKEALADLVARENAAKPLSDSRLAQLLTDAGYAIARRTVAKYRESLRIPSVETRSR
ncbi:MAG TPA: RNA polymerase factor sigma-54 [Armatimonadota bacterium]|jgi:RNA polymerase sigma-54 factor